MEMNLSPTQAAICEACTTILRRAAGPARARELRAEGGADGRVLGLLADAGYLDLALDAESGPLAAALVTELAATHLALAPVGVRALVVPTVLPAGDLPNFVAIVDAAIPGPVRYAAQAEALIVIDGDEARFLRAGEFTATETPTLFGYPMATVELHGKGAELAPGAGDVARRWWRVAIAVEVAGTARAAFDLTSEHLRGRVQFGKPLAAFQAIQHRMMETHVLIEGAKWLAREAAHHGASTQQSASAALAAVEAAGRTLFEVHQLSGSIGFTHEYDLTLSSLRLQALRVEAGGLAHHAKALVSGRWQ